QKKNVKKIKSYPLPLSFVLLNNLIDYYVKDKQLLIYYPPECVGPPVQIYHDVFTEIYYSEHKRSIVFKEKIHKLFGKELRMISLEDDFKNDGILESNVFSKSVLRFLVEIKNEIGTSSCDPTIQASASFAKYYTQKTYGKLYTSYFYKQSSPCRASDTTFQSFVLESQQAKNTIVEFIYEEKLVDHKLHWRAITKDEQKIIVKFAWQYNRRVHKLCYEIGKAPKLLYISKKMVDSFYMVVMNYVEAESLYNCSLLSCDKYKAILRDVKDAIDKLHKESIVGKDKIEYYPSFMNHKHINWPPEAEDRKKLSCKHDIYWLELLKSKFLGESVDLE
ncbi:19594_t:CDS:2, partial [Racocetra persica]